MQPSPEPETGSLEDERIVLRCQLGERAAFDDLIRRWAAPVAAYARRVSQDEDAAADLAQDIWLRAFRGIDRLREPRRFRSWLFGIAHRAFADALRRRYATPAFVSDEIEDVADDGAGDHEDMDRMELGLAKLPPVEREVLTLFYLQELALEEIADVLAIPAGTVKSRLHRARRLLRQELEEGERT